MPRFILIASLIFLCQEGLCNQSFYKERGKGWHWYETKKIEKEEEVPQTSQLTPTQQVEEIRQDVKEKLHKAMIDPSEANVISYMRAQEKIADSSEEFAKMWKRIVYKYPQMDRTIKHPVSSNALHIARGEELLAKRQKIKDLSHEYGLMYFYKGDCKYCEGFAKVVKSFSKFYKWEVMPVQIGSIESKEFPNAKMDNGIAGELGITVVPALIAVHPKSKKMVPLSYGYISESEIEDRVHLLITGGKE